ncbi:unnamed protein product [Prorocentrum cordatum]|uniref:Uncharacterized protein n=1 Tax=Prorocentrum cordatum TaxID=2364126 RepID=A0ABN9WU04_9DINO|nr:unnamed protein product [Polarella glacialis]
MDSPSSADTQTLAETVGAKPCKKQRLEEKLPVEGAIVISSGNPAHAVANTAGANDAAMEDRVGAQVKQLPPAVKSDDQLDDWAELPSSFEYELCKYPDAIEGSVTNSTGYLNAQLGAINTALEKVSAVLLPLQRMHASKYQPTVKPKAKGKAKAAKA